MKNILVAVDFHDKTDVILKAALQQAKVTGAKVWLVHVSAPDPDFVGYGVGPQYIRDFRAQELKEEHKQLNEYGEYFNTHGIEAEGLLIQGVTTDLILEEAKKLEIDLIICGHHHDHNFIYNLFFSSVSAELIQESKVPVLVVPC